MPSQIQSQSARLTSPRVYIFCLLLFLLWPAPYVLGQEMAKEAAKDAATEAAKDTAGQASPAVKPASQTKIFFKNCSKKIASLEWAAYETVRSLHLAAGGAPLKASAVGYD